jgi:RNA polymerase sigma-70 factor, ECF subfamily
MTTPTTTEAIWTRLSADLRRFFSRRVADQHLADDLLQETFVRIHRSAHTLLEADRLAAWVYQIARNVLTDHYRSKSTGPSPLADDVAANDDRAADDERPAPGCAAEWLAEMVGQLPDGYRQAVQLAEIDGLSQQETADRLGLSLSGAKSRIQRGRAMLKQILLGCCDFELDRRGNVIDYTPRPDRTVCLGPCGPDWPT